MGYIDRIQVLMLTFFLINASMVCGHSHTAFIPRLLSTDSSFELSLTDFDRYYNGMRENPALQVYIKPFYMQSSAHTQLARYFLPHNKTCVTLDQMGFGDIDPLWFSLIAAKGTAYTSTVCLCPERKAYGALFTLYANLTCRWWISLTTVAMKVKHNLGLTERGLTNPGILPGFANACQAFNNPDWTAGKLACTSLSQAGADDIQLKCGYDFCKKSYCHATLYAVGTVPTGHGTTARYMFEPVVGSRHGSLGIGFDGDYTVYDIDKHHVTLLADVKYRYVFSACERRSFDLCINGDWSRYLLVVTQDQPLDSMPGINLLTFPTRVTPRSTLDIWLAGNYKYDDWTFEVGYDFWWRQSEKVCPKCPLASGYGIQTLALCSLPYTSASTATISQAAVGANATHTDANFTTIRDANLNLASGAHPMAVSNKIYADIGYMYTASTCAVIFGIGSSYEVGSKNALSQWSVWVTQGITF